jgi:uncharacterized protein YndB with AHSA1/START domain
MLRYLILILSVCALARGASAEVLDSQLNGFTVTEKTTISASSEKVWEVLTKPEFWWSSDHTYSHNSHNLHLDPIAGGAWVETLENGGSVRHMVVVYIDPPTTLRLEGALGPLQALGATGHLTYKLRPLGRKTEVTLLYDVGGHSAGGWTGLAAAVDGVLGEQLGRLKAVAENGATP